MTMYEKIRKLCKNKGFEISNLSKYIPALNISKGSISKWKNGAVPRADKMKAIADYFGVSVEWLQDTSEQGEKLHGQAEELKHNEIIICDCDGNCVRKVLKTEQIQALKTMIESLPDAPDDI